MIGRGIACGLGKSVAGIFRIVFDHQLISRDLGHDRGGSDTCNGGIAVNDIAFAGDGAQRVSIHKNAIGLDACIGYGAGNGLAQCPRHPDLVDSIGSDMADAQSRSEVCNLRSEDLSLRRRQLLGIIQTPYDRLAGKLNGANRKRARDRTATDLVDAQNDSVAAELPHHLIHVEHAIVLRTLALIPSECALACLPDLLAGIFRISIDQIEDLIERSACELGGQLRRGGRTRHVCHKPPRMDNK